MYPTNWLHHLITEWQLYLSGCRGRNTCHHPWLLFRPVLSKSLGSALRRYPEFHCYSPPPLLHSSPTTTVSYLGYCAHLLVFLLLAPFSLFLTHQPEWFFQKASHIIWLFPSKPFNDSQLTENKSKIFPRTAWANLNWPLVTSLHSSPGPPCDLVSWAQMLLPQDPCTCCPLCQGLSCPMSTGIVSLLPPHPLFSIYIHIVPLQSGCIYMVALTSLNTLLPSPFHFSPQHSSADILCSYSLVHRLSLPGGREFHEGGEFCQFCSLRHPPGTMPNTWEQALALHSRVSGWINEWMKGRDLPSFLTKPDNASHSYCSPLAASSGART